MENDRSSGKIREAQLLGEGALKGAKPLPVFLAELRRSEAWWPPVEEQLVVVQQARVLFSTFYSNLFLKRGLHAVDPVRRLERLESRLREARQDESQRLSMLEFHRRMTEIFAGVRDLHMAYGWPEPFDGQWAYLGFEVEEFFRSDGRRCYLANHVNPELGGREFGDGVEILAWNGMDIERAVELNADQHPGSNSAARRAWGVTRMTLRPLRTSPPPDEDRVILRFRSKSGAFREIRFPWYVIPYRPGAVPLKEEEADEFGTETAISFEGDGYRWIRQALYGARKLELKGPGAGSKVVRSVKHLFSSEPKQHAFHRRFPFGYMRIFSFSWDDEEEFFAEFERRLRELPHSGLILDVRDNPGGKIPIAEGLLARFIARPLQAERFQFVANELTHELSRRHGDFGSWRASLADALATGARYSAAFPITRNLRNSPRIFYGPIVLITNARSYSATDMFAAGFMDNRIGEILGTNRRTGAGGAAVVRHKKLRTILRRAFADSGLDLPLVPLPQGVGMSVALLRAVRVGSAKAGRPLEDLGVTPGHLHRMTRDDLLDGNKDLIRAAARILTQRGDPARAQRLLHVRSSLSPGRAELEVRSQGQLKRIDVVLDDVPVPTESDKGGVTARYEPMGMPERIVVRNIPPEARELRVRGLTPRLREAVGYPVRLDRQERTA